MSDSRGEENMITRRVSISLATGEAVSGIIDLPAGFDSRRGTGIVMAHGAGNDMRNPLLEAFAEGMARAGFLSLRFNFLFKERGKKAPDPPKRLEAAWRAAYDYLHDHEEFGPRRIIGAGKSLGGRIAAQMAAEGSLPVERLLFLGYPLHPPGQKHRLRDAPLTRIRIPMLFFTGTRDSLCDLDLLQGVLEGLETNWELETIETGDHSFNVLKSAGRSREEVWRDMVRKTAAWLRSE
jgi:predicted alpha/beta-hydrolase family hydrolase